jgi:hypothetical protein
MNGFETPNTDATLFNSMTHPNVVVVDDIENDASRGNSGRSTPTTRDRKLGGNPGDAGRRTREQQTTPRGRIGTVDAVDGHVAEPMQAAPPATTNEVRVRRVI